MDSTESETEDGGSKRLATFEKTSSRMSKETSQVLDPENPLLERFQKALKEHLERQIHLLKDDIFEFETGTKKNNAKREQIGVMVYEQQQVLNNQQKILDRYISKLETTTAAREELQNVVTEKKDLYKKKHEAFLEAESNSTELRSEIEGINLLIRQVSRWEENLESDITVKKRIFEKCRKDKLKLLQEKRLQDALIYKLMMRIWHLEQELERMDLQMKVKHEEREELAQTVALGNTNIEAMESEYRCLMHSWNSVIVAIGNRDKVLACLNKESFKSTENFKSILSEIEQVKKMTQKEMRRNEELTMLKERFLNDCQNCKTALDAETVKRVALEKKINEMEGIIEQTELDNQKIAEETHDSNSLLSSLLREHEFLDKEKGEVEEQILKELGEQETCNKTSNSLRRVFKDTKARNRAFGIQIASLENKIAAVMSQIEVQKLANFESLRYLEELEEQLKSLGKDADHYQEVIRELDIRIAKRTREVDMLNSKLQKIIEKSGTSYTSPLEAKITALEKNIEEIQEQNKKLQQFWLREQGNLLKISEERQEQIHNNSLIRKQILILEQKNLKVSDELEAHKNQQDKVLRAINNLHSQLTVMGDNFVKTKGLKMNMDKDNEVMRQDYVYKLKDAELECLQLQDEIEALEEDKVSMSNELIEMNRQVLEWEKKFLSAKETKSNMQQERADTGEVGAMKAEIHRMNVRYGQLKKVQDVLVKDLEHCVTRRDGIITTAEARERKNKGGMEKIRINFQRKLDDIRNKTKYMENQIEEMLKRMQAYDHEKLKIEKEIDSINVEIQSTKSHHEELQETVEELITQRQMNFELLLQVQKKLNTYTDLSKGRNPHVAYRTESAVISAYSREIGVNSKLIKILENLQGDFPNHIHELNRLSNTLKLPVYVYFQ